MLHLHCPNIKTEILELRSKIGELEGLKRVLLQGDDSYDESLVRLQHVIIDLITNINKKNDEVANEIILPEIKNSGKYILVGNFYQGRARIRDKDSNCFHVDLDRMPTYSARFKYTGDYHEDRATVIDSDYKCFHVGLDGKPLYDNRYKLAGDYSQGRAWVQDFYGNYFHVGLDSKPVYSEKYRYVSDYSQGISKVKDFDNNVFYIDLDGNRIPD
jgi:hypothetical protein